MLGEGVYFPVYDFRVITQTGLIQSTNEFSDTEFPLVSATVKSGRNRRSTAEIVVPEVEGLVQGAIRKNDLVTLRLGHAQIRLDAVFYGFVRRVEFTDREVRLLCDDSAWVMDAVVREGKYTDQSLEAVLEDLVSYAYSNAQDYIGKSFNLRVGDITAPGTVNKLTLARSTCFEAMVSLCDEFGLDWFFVPGKPELQVNPPFAVEQYNDPPLLVVGLNITADSKFRYSTGDEYGRVLLWGVDESKDERPIKSEVGSGVPVYFSEISGGLSQAELDERANLILARSQEMQITGEMTTIGRGDIVHSAGIAVGEFAPNKAEKWNRKKGIEVAPARLLGRFAVENVEHRYNSGAFLTKVKFAEAV